MPVVVNTMGWVKGFGLSLLRDVVLATQPCRVFTLQSGNPVRDVPAGTSWIGEGAPPPELLRPCTGCFSWQSCQLRRSKCLDASTLVAAPAVPP